MKTCLLVAVYTTSSLGSTVLKEFTAGWKTLLGGRVPKCCVLNLYLCLRWKIHISFPFSSEEYEEALKVNVLLDFFLYINSPTSPVFLQDFVCWF